MDPMKPTILFLLAGALGITADHTFVTNQTNTELAGMNPALLARIPMRMQEFVDAGKTPGVVTLVARHGHIAALSAVGYQDLERKLPMRPDSIFRVMSVTK